MFRYRYYNNSNSFRLTLEVGEEVFKLGGRLRDGGEGTALGLGEEGESPALGGGGGGAEVGRGGDGHALELACCGVEHQL